MTLPLRILIVEDSADDAEVALLELVRGGIAPDARRVESAAELCAALAEGPWDAVLSDYTMPGFGAVEAFALCRAADPDVPFVVVSGTIGEQRAVEMMRAGAGDYLLKGNLARLSAAVEREVREAENRRARRRAEQANALLASVVASSDDAIVSESLDGLVTSWNPAAERLYGWAAAEAVGRPVSPLVPPDKAAERARIIGELRAGGRVVNVETARLHRDGGRIDVSLTVSPIRDAAGRLVGVSKIARDIRVRMRADVALREREQLLQTIIAHIPCGLFWKDRNSVLLGCNNQFAGDFGAPHPEALIGKTDDALAGAVAFVASDRQVIESGVPLLNVEEPHDRPGGETTTLLTSKVPLRGPGGAVVGVLGVYQDITERKRAEGVLRFQHALLRCQTEASPDGMLVVDPGGHILSYNRRFLDVWGIPDELAATGDDTIVLAAARSRTADPDGFFARVAAIYADPDVQSQDEVALADGRTLERYSGPIRGAGVELLGRVWYFRDITARKRGEAERADLLARLNLQVERMPLAYLLSGPDFHYTRWNPAAERVFGFTEAEALGRHPFDVVVPPQARPLVGDILGRLAAGEMNAHGVCENVTRDGRTITCEWYNTPLFDAAGIFTGILSLAQDVTDRKSLEEKFRQAQKMEAVGRLAGGVAHDFNNLLTVINGYGEIVHDSLPADHPSSGLVAEIRTAGERAAGLTRQLLAYSRQTVLETRVLDVNALVRNLESMLRRLIGEDVDLATRLAPALGRVKADPGQLEQAIVNLCVNARDAMPLGGQITIETHEVELDETHAASHPDVRPGHYAQVTVTDTGEGMTPEVLARIFEPFYTTKGAGKGTGLGLAMVFGFAKQSGGHVAVSSKPGRGATFKLYLPLIGETPSGKPTASPAAMPKGTETVLLVEDEDAVRALGRHVLKLCGYVVLDAADGREAVRVAEGHPGRIHLLVTDVVMPGGMGGREVAEAVVALHPEARVLYTSGYTDDAVVRHGVLEAGTHFLQKPFAPAAFAGKVREILDVAAEDTDRIVGQTAG